MKNSAHLDSAAGYTACADAVILENKNLLGSFLERMLLVRNFEQELVSLFAEGRLHGTVHACIGEEAACIGTTAALKKEDYMVSTHRGHGHTIGKGCDINAMMAEIFGKESGISRGRGGSMHMSDPDVGALGSNGIVGAGTPIACGAGLTIKLKKIPDRVSLVFFGDGASNEGAVHESMNLASAWDLPVMFVLINNRYGLSMPVEKAVKETDFTKRATAYGIKYFECDGNDVLSVYETVAEAREYCVKNHRPVFVLENTYRMAGHSKSDDNSYRDSAEIELWKTRDPIDRFRALLIKNRLFSKDELLAIEKNASRVIENAVEYGMAQPMPDPGDVLKNV